MFGVMGMTLLLASGLCGPVLPFDDVHMWLLLTLVAALLQTSEQVALSFVWSPEPH